MFRNHPTPRKPAARVRLGVQQLEARDVPAVSLLSALAVGSAAGDSAARDVAADAAGNSYLVGIFSGTADFDPGPGTALLTARGTADAYVAKYAPDGSLVWVKRMGGDAAVSTGTPYDDGARAVAVDGGGNVVVAGQFIGTADFGGTTLTAAGGRDAFVAKLGPTGQVLWAKRWGAANNDEQGFGVGADAAGNVYALGDRDGQNLANNGDDVLKFSPAGSLLWTRSVDITYSGRALADGDLAVDAAGNVYAADTFNGTVDFDPGPQKKLVSSAENQGFVLKLTAAGAYSWVSTFRGVSSDFDLSRTLRVALDGIGGVFVGGTYVGSVDFDPGPGTTTLPASTGFNGFLTKLTATTGALVWARAVGSADPGSNVMVYGLAADAAGNVYATGFFQGTTDFDPGAGSWLGTSVGGSSDAFVVKLTAGGSFGWAATFGAAGADVGRGVAVDPAGTVHLAGSFQGTVDFDPDPLGTYDLTSPGTYSSSFLVRLRQT
jgi:hypothetical protein